ncbi:hypothetical protein [Parapedobacter soli]|uniref:hypothetical protein n=1 Tax=Parapedobacter soli TaxID=416955 RepID=UPI0021C664F0|nr:hypothetical protein [Parapedobacter soli]
MQSTRLSLQSILTALDLDAACLPLLEQAPARDDLLRAHTPESIYIATRTIGDILNAQEKADRLADDLAERINIVTHKLKFITEESKPNVLFLADVSPMRPIYDAYLETITRFAGGIPIQATHASAAEAAADVIVIINDKPIPQLLATLPGLFTVPAYIIHHPNHLRQPGALIADDIEILAEILYPKQFFFGRDEDVWMKFD